MDIQLVLVNTFIISLALPHRKSNWDPAGIPVKSQWDMNIPVGFPHPTGIPVGRSQQKVGSWLGSRLRSQLNQDPSSETGIPVQKLGSQSNNWDPSPITGIPILYWDPISNWDLTYRKIINWDGWDPRKGKTKTFVIYS